MKSFLSNEDLIIKQKDLDELAKTHYELLNVSKPSNELSFCLGYRIAETKLMLKLIDEKLERLRLLSEIDKFSIFPHNSPNF